MIPGTCEGNADLRAWASDFTRKVHRPAFADFEVLLHPGNTNAWSKIVGLLVEKGDYILTENFTYPSSQALWIPQGNYAAPVALDGQGLRADSLEEVLSTWDRKHPGVKRPHVLYMVSVGSNPTGLTMGTERRKSIYDICVKYGTSKSAINCRLHIDLLFAIDIIIVEDDPYYFIQYPEYKVTGSKPVQEILPSQNFLDSLSPSLLRYDYQGRVIRLESFSKSLAPGLRLGYFIANPIFAERLLRATEVETQDPSGFSQALVFELLKNWGFDGYLAWQQRLRMEYRTRRDWLLDAFAVHFDLLPAKEVLGPKRDGVVACMRHENGSTPIFNFIVPTGGMFIWTHFLLSQNPRFGQIKSDASVDGAEEVFAREFWSQLAENLVSGAKGSFHSSTYKYSPVNDI
jgi:aromatic amino acid aminotransferase I